MSGAPVITNHPMHGGERLDALELGGFFEVVDTGAPRFHGHSWCDLGGSLWLGFGLNDDSAPTNHPAKSVERAPRPSVRDRVVASHNPTLASRPLPWIPRASV